MSEQTLHLVQVIRSRLHAAIRRITMADLVYGLVLTLGILAAVWLGLVAVEVGFWMDVAPRRVAFWVFLAVALGLVGYFLVIPLLRLTGLLGGLTEESVARRIGMRYPEVSDRLVNLLHLVEGRRSDAPAPMVEGAVRMLGEQVQQVPFERVETFERAKRAGRLASLPVVGLLVFLLAAPGAFLGASHRLVSPGETFQRPAPFTLRVEPGSVDLVKGASLDITVVASGSELPRTLTLALNNVGEAAVDEVRLVADSAGVFRHALVNVRQSLRYRVSASPVQTGWYTATVTERPIVRNLQVDLAYPAYTGIPPQRLVPNVGDVTALPGTRIGVEIEVGGREVAEAALRFDDGTTEPLEIEDGTATGAFQLRRDGSYQVLLRNRQGVENSDPITYSLKLVADAVPSVVILEPEPLAELDESLRADLRVRINDDFGFSGLRLFYRLAESRFGDVSETFAPIPLPLTAPRQLDQEMDYAWLLSEGTGLDPVPGDVIEYYVEVRDNDAFAGFKPARSATHRLRLPSLAEQYEALDDAQDESEAELEGMLNEVQEIRDEFQELRDELRRKQEGDWEDKRQIERIQQRQQALEQQVDDLSDQIESVTEQMEENNLVSESTLEMYKELQRVAEEINSPELMDALQQLQQAMEQLDLQQMQDSIENFEFNEQQYQQRMERTMDLLKNLQVQQKLDEAARRAEELAREQEQLSEQTRDLTEDAEDEDAEDEDAEDEDAEGEDAEDEDAESENQDGENQDGENQDGENQDGENQDGEQQEGEQQEGEQQEGEQQEGEQQEGEQQNGENQDGENQDGEQQNGEQQEGEQQNGEQQEGEQQNGEQQEGEQQNGEQQEGEPRNSEELAREQERSAEEMRQLEELMKEIQERMQDTPNTPQEQMEQLNDQTQQQQLPEQMEQNAEQLRQQQMQDAQQGQQQMQQQLQGLQQQLQQMQQGMQGQQQQINFAGLRRALSDVLTLSQQQEDLRGEVNASPADTPRLRDYAQRQVELSEGLRVVSDTLQSLASEIPQMTREVQQQAGDALRSMSDATGSLADRASRQASGQQKSSMMHLNELALMLSNLMDQMMNSQSGGSGGMSMQQMIQQLQDMAGSQQQLNQQIQQMLNDMQGNRLTTDMQERLRQLGAQQDAMRRQLKEMSRNRELGNQVMGDLNRIAQQMEETVQELQRERVNRQTVQRQQQILTRLLNASRSMREQGRENRREGRSADDVSRDRPGDLPPAEQAEQLRRALLRALESGYAPDYQELIKRYFELLQESEE